MMITSFALSYLQSFEKLYFLGEDGEDTSLPRPNLWSLANNASQVIPQLFDKGMMLNHIWKRSLLWFN